MIDTIRFTCYAKAEPQGSMRAFVIGGRSRLTSSNSKMKSYRQELAAAALRAKELQEFFAGKHEAVHVEIHFYFARGLSIPKRRLFPTVKPDIDKLERATCDALTGILYEDDGQIVSAGPNRKYYGSPERVEVLVSTNEKHFQAR